MAITGGDRLVWRALREKRLIPANPRVLEMGKANWYGDIPAEDFCRDHREFGPAVELPREPIDTWRAADLYYRIMLGEHQRVAIDLDPHAPPPVLGHDLNTPFPTGHLRFDIVVNTGTGEHVFDQRQFWENCHEACKPGGLMVHGVPLWGWPDHGFYNYHPTFVADVAAENGYDIAAWFAHVLEPGFAAPVTRPADFIPLYQQWGRHSAMMHFAFVKRANAPFKVPMQGVYSSRATAADKSGWLSNR